MDAKTGLCSFHKLHGPEAVRKEDLSGIAAATGPHETKPAPKTEGPGIAEPDPELVASIPEATIEAWVRIHPTLSFRHRRLIEAYAKGIVRTSDVAAELGCSENSISVANSQLKTRLGLCIEGRSIKEGMRYRAAVYALIYRRMHGL